jgi:hypothetical protein
MLCGTMCIDITVQIEDHDIRLTVGTPDELGCERVSSHMMLTSTYMEVRLWLVDRLDSAEKQNVVSGIFSYMDKAVWN